MIHAERGVIRLMGWVGGGCAVSPHSHGQPAVSYYDSTVDTTLLSMNTRRRTEGFL